MGAFDLRVSAFESILTIKAKIQRHEGIPISQQHLIWQSTEMEDDSCLEDYGVYEGASLKLVLSMRGGPINIRRVPTDDSLKEMKTFVEANVDELLDKTLENQKITLLVYKDGEQYKFCRFMDVGDGNITPLSATLSERNVRRTSNSECFFEDLDTKQKVMELQQKMEKMNLRKKNKKMYNIDKAAPCANNTFLTRRDREKIQPVLDYSNLQSKSNKIESNSNSNSNSYKSYENFFSNKLTMQSKNSSDDLNELLDKEFNSDLKTGNDYILNSKINSEFKMEHL